MQLEFHQIDAFTDRPFRGNPAVVYRLDAWLEDELMQRIAAEHNQAETAFTVREGSPTRTAAVTGEDAELTLSPREADRLLAIILAHCSSS